MSPMLMVGGLRCSDFLSGLRTFEKMGFMAAAALPPLPSIDGLSRELLEKLA